MGKSGLELRSPGSEPSTWTVSPSGGGSGSVAPRPAGPCHLELGRGADCRPGLGFASGPRDQIPSICVLASPRVALTLSSCVCIHFRMHVPMNTHVHGCKLVRRGLTPRLRSHCYGQGSFSQALPSTESLGGLKEICQQ